MFHILIFSLQHFVCHTNFVSALCGFKKDYKGSKNTLKEIFASSKNFPHSLTSLIPLRVVRFCQTKVFFLRFVIVVIVLLYCVRPSLGPVCTMIRIKKFIYFCKYDFTLKAFSHSGSITLIKVTLKTSKR